MADKEDEGTLVYGRSLVSVAEEVRYGEIGNIGFGPRLVRTGEIQYWKVFGIVRKFNDAGRGQLLSAAR